jgi:hypothetical protein
MSQVAVPMIARGLLAGVLFAESRQRLAFDAEHAAALEALAGQAAATLALIEDMPAEGAGPEPEGHAAPDAGSFRVTAYAHDNSVCIDDRYVIRGVAGRLLVFLLERSDAEGRSEFTNREIRRVAELQLPEFKDNLETRLLLLRRRLEERAFPVRLVQAGRGRIRVVTRGRPRIERRP